MEWFSWMTRMWSTFLERFFQFHPSPCLLFNVHVVYTVAPFLFWCLNNQPCLHGVSNMTNPAVNFLENVAHGLPASEGGSLLFTSIHNVPSWGHVPGEENDLNPRLLLSIWSRCCKWGVCGRVSCLQISIVCVCVLSQSSHMGCKNWLYWCMLTSHV